MYYESPHDVLYCHKDFKSAGIKISKDHLTILVGDVGHIPKPYFFCPNWNQLQRPTTNKVVKLTVYSEKWPWVMSENSIYQVTFLVYAIDVGKIWTDAQTIILI